MKDNMEQDGAQHAIVLVGARPGDEFEKLKAELKGLEMRPTDCARSW